MLALREAVLGLLLGASLVPAMTIAQGPARPAAAPPSAAAPSPAAPTTPPAAAPTRPAAAPPAAASPPPSTARPAATAPGTAPPPGAGTAASPPTPSPTSTGATSTEGTPPPPPSLAPVAATPPGSIGGQLGLLRGGVPRHGVVYLENAPAGSWTLPKERPQLALRSFSFQPEFIVVPVGQTVQLINADRLMHGPFSLSPPKSFEIGRHAAGETHTLTFDRLGVVDLFCNIHDTEQGAVVVVPSTFFSLLAPDGNFQIGGVPPGRYRLIGYSLEAEMVSQVVEVRSRERTIVKLQLGVTGQPALGREKLK